MRKNSLTTLLYLQEINKCEQLDSIDNIIESAAYDDSLSNKEYEYIYNEALKRSHEILGF